MVPGYCGYAAWHSPPPRTDAGTADGAGRGRGGGSLIHSVLAALASSQGRHHGTSSYIIVMNWLELHCLIILTTQHCTLGIDAVQCKVKVFIVNLEPKAIHMIVEDTMDTELKIH